MAGGAAQSGGEAAAEGMVPLHGGSGSVVPGSGKLRVDGEAEGGQLALIRAAFAGDDVEQDFEAEKAAEVAAELPKEEVVGVLPGWGVWANQQKEPRWVTAAREKAAREREKAAASRADAALKFVVLSEKWDKKAMTKYSTQSVPFPFDSKDTYERSMRQPLGRQYNADSAFRDLTRPAVLKNTGVVIEPIRYTKPVAQKAEEVAAKQVKAKVLTVAGGMFKQPKKRQQ
ncbi:uncharacterized protein HaLaN_30772 [Haematococcus lacustris]|uniref:Uncharacterized protein n=2 Tax=Haematococcus lacustris TaxID=44745 RepID=A0A6A0AHI0_HAELA|nr:uncharacterized protein HaLaN_30772 [Haematococcus lacustris]